jgi:hypothetical protein
MRAQRYSPRGSKETRYVVQSATWKSPCLGKGQQGEEFPNGIISSVRPFWIPLRFYAWGGKKSKRRRLCSA